METKLERLAHGLMLAPLAPLAGLLCGWWSAYALLPEAWIPFAAIAGLLAGILADVFLLKKYFDRRLSLTLWVAVYLFYSMGIFGFVMGVPVFNAALAIPAGFVVGSRLAAEHADPSQVRKAEMRTAWFTSGVLGLGFEVTQGMIIGLILIGGAALLAGCWGLSVASVRLTCMLLQRKA
jgi:hypothetical protein